MAIKFRALFGRSDSPQQERKGTISPKGPGAKPANDYRAVSLRPGPRGCCAAATEVAAKPRLLREASRLPLPGCTQPTTCTCTFRKLSDRRDEDRRVLGMSDTLRSFGRAERRARARRSSKAGTDGR